jgi:hypothetical protein
MEKKQPERAERGEGAEVGEVAEGGEEMSQTKSARVMAGFRFVPHHERKNKPACCGFRGGSLMDGHPRTGRAL